MREALWLSAVTMAAGTVWYIRLIVTRKIDPVLASWIIIATTMTLGLFSYLHSPVHTFQGNIGNTVGFASTGSILAALLLVGMGRKEVRVQFNAFQKRCLAAAGLIAALWVILRFVVEGEVAASIANVLTQILMLIGFAPMVQKMWGAVNTSEPLFTWMMISASSVFAFIASVLVGNKLGMLYGIRATLTAGLVAILILRIRSRTSATKGASV